MDNDLTIHQIIENQVKNNPYHTAIFCEGVTYSYNEINQKANQLAHYLQTFALKPDTLIAIAMNRTPQLLIGILGILKAGCAYLPLDVTHPKERLQYIVEDTKTPVLITQSASLLPSFIGHTINMEEDWQKINMYPSHNLSSSATLDNLAYAIYTSGSTGKPKGVLIEHRSVTNYSKWFNHYSACQQQNRIDFSSNIIFDMAITTTITALALGLQIVICADEIKKNVRQYLLYLNKNKINIIKMTPSYFNAMVEEANHHFIELPDLQSIILGGEILYTSDCLAWLNTYPRHFLFNEYGPTETTVAVTQYKITHDNILHLGTTVPIGKPGSHMTCTLINNDKEVISCREIGELHIGGIGLARGYLNQAALTAKQFIKNPFAHSNQTTLYKSGDVCRYLPDGNIEFIKRIDDQIKIRGYRIEPSEIEISLTSHPLIKEASIIADSNQLGEKQLVAYYIPKNKNECPTPHELRLYLQQQLADYMIPATFIRMQAFPLNGNDKRDKNAFPKPVFTNEIATSITPLENQLIQIWQKAFQLKEINITSHFFELGGHSLIAARIIAAIEVSLGKKIRLDDLYKSPTIRELTLVIETAEKSSKDSSMNTTTLQTSPIIPLADFQFMFWISNFFEPKTKKLNIIARKRLSGKLDKKALTSALDFILKKHEIFSYHIGKYLPAQYYTKKRKQIDVIEADLTTYSAAETNIELTRSLDNLINHYPWQKNNPLITVKVFYLQNEKSELQISVPHIIFDDASEGILFSELSSAYLHYKNGTPLPSIGELNQYKYYIFHEKNHLNQNLKRDILFWENYLQDASLIAFPESEIIHHMKNIPYSTYIELSDVIIKNVHQTCKANFFSITDLVCAAVALTLKKVTGQVNNNIFINIIRSVRNNDIHDKTIGCFLRLDPIKVDIKRNRSLIELAKSIQKSRIDTEPYQACSGMVKLACLDKTHRKKFIKRCFTRLISSIYCVLFSKLKLNYKMLSMYGRLNLLRKKQQFLIDINLLNNFIHPKKNSSLFGLTIDKTQTHQYDLSNIDNVLDICILKNDSLGKTYLVISGNLKTTYRQQIGNEIVNCMNNVYQEEEYPIESVIG